MPQPPTRKFSGIFISYRRGDTAAHAGRLYDRLSAHFGEDQVFMDIDHIEPGDDFVQVIKDRLGDAEVLITIIGKDWLVSTDGGARRLDNPDDFVRLEITIALTNNIRVIPVLVEGVTMPGPQDLPEALSPLSRRQAHELSDKRWRHDVDELIDTLEKVLAQRKAARLTAAQGVEEPQRRATAEEKEQAPPDEPRRRRAEESERESREAADESRERAVEGGRAATRPGVVGRRVLLGATASAVIIAGVAAVAWLAAGDKQGVTDNRVFPSPTGATGPSQPPGTLTGQGAAGNPVAPEGMVYAPGGKFTMGRDDGDAYERPAHVETVKPFFIDAHEVTCADYEQFMRDKGVMKYGPCPPDAARKPATGVTWDEADAFCRTRGKRLPSEAEWEFAARGTDGRLYPWGGAWQTGLANAAGAKKVTTDVGSYGKGASPFGAFDMVGNVWEWTTSDMAAYPGGKLPAQPAEGAKVLRGGSYLSNKEQATATYRFGWRARAESSYEQTGFRCVKETAASNGER